MENNIFGLLDPNLISKDDLKNLKILTRAAKISWENHKSIPDCCDEARDICNDEGIEWNLEQFIFSHGFQYGVQSGKLLGAMDNDANDDIKNAIASLRNDISGAVDTISKKEVIKKGVKHCQITVDKDAGKIWINIEGQNSQYIEAISVEVIEG